MFFEYLQNYLTILIFLFVAIGVGIAFIVVNFLCAPSKPDAEKLSAYECGFEPFGDSRMKFDVRIYSFFITNTRDFIGYRDIYSVEFISFEHCLNKFNLL